MRRIYVVLFLVIVIVLAAGCSTAQQDAIGIRGEVTSINTSGDTLSLLVEGEVEKDTSFDKASVRIKPETKVVRKDGDKDAAANAEDIKLFDKVEVVFDGAVAESYPVQGSAKLIRILN